MVWGPFQKCPYLLAEREVPAVLVQAAVGPRALISPPRSLDTLDGLAATV